MSHAEHSEGNDQSLLPCRRGNIGAGLLTRRVSTPEHWDVEGLNGLKKTLRDHATDVDARARFPHEAVSQLRSMGLMRFFVPTDRGGAGGSFLQFARTAATISSECASTAMIWVMHCQQNRVISDWMPRLHSRTINPNMEHDPLIASVTTDPESGGSLFASDAELSLAPTGKWSFVRVCPVVSYGTHATHFLMLISRRDAGQRRVVLCLVDRNSATIDDVEDYATLGMRGTRTIGLTLSGVTSSGSIIDRDIREIVVRSYNTTANVGWSAVWYGAAWGAYRRALRFVRSSGHALESRLVVLGEMRVLLDAIRSSIRDISTYVDDQCKSRDWNKLARADTTIALHSTKVQASRLCFRIVDQLMDLVGFREGYTSDSSLCLERVFRDLRSASLMISNYSYVKEVGRLSVVEPRLLL